MSIKKNLFVLKILSFIFFCFYFSMPASAAKVISDDLYVAYPKVNETLAVDVSQKITSPDYQSLITYAAHGKGNQLLGYEYRPEKDGYIIYLGNSTQKVIGSTKSNTAKVTMFTIPINSYTEFSDDYIWDIIQAEETYYKIRNRKTGTYLTVTKAINDALVTLASDNGGDSQKFNLKTMNGVYKIKAFNNYSYKYLWSIPGEAQEGKEVASYPENGDINQYWMILFKPSDNAYVISSFLQKDFIITQETESGSPKIRKNTASFETPLGATNVFDFKLLGNTANGQSKVAIKNSNFSGYYRKDYNVTGGVSALSLYPYNSSYENLQWVLDKVRDIPKPEIKNLKIASANSHSGSFFYVGEELTVTGDFKGAGYNTYNLYSVFNTDEPVLNQKDIRIDGSGDSTFSSKIDTSKYKEGTFYIEVYARADSMFQSNRVNEKYKLVYPTPSGEAIPQTITKGTPINTLKPSNFVKNLHDEMGNTVTATKIEGINTNVLGTQEAKVTLANKFKTEVVTVPVTIVSVAKTTQVEFSNEDGTGLGVSPITFTESDEKMVDLREIKEVKAILTGELNQYEVVGAEDSRTNSAIDVANFKVGSTASVKLVLKKKPPTQITTSIKFLNSKDELLDNNMTSKNRVGDVINLNEIAKETIARIKNQGYEVDKVEAFDFASISYKPVKDPTAYKVPESSNGTGVVNYYFKKALITTTIKFFNTDDKSEIMKEMISTNSIGDIINLNTIAKNTISAIKNLGYEIEKVEAFDFASTSFKPVSDPTNYKVLANPNGTGMVNYYFKKIQVKTTVQFTDEKGDAIKGIDSVQFTEAIGETIDLLEVKEIKEKLASVSVQYEPIEARDSSNNKIPTYPKYKIGSQSDNNLKLVLRNKKQTISIKFLDDKGGLIEYRAMPTDNPVTISLDIGKTYDFKNGDNTEIQHVRDILERLKIDQGYSELIKIENNKAETLDETTIKINKDTTEISYYLKRVKQPITIEFLDPNGATLAKSIETSSWIGDFVDVIQLTSSTRQKLELNYTLEKTEAGTGNFTGHTINDSNYFAEYGVEKIRYTFAPKDSVETKVQFVEEGEETPIATVPFSGKLNSEIANLTTVPAIKAKLDELSKEYIPTGATDKNGKVIATYPKYTIGATEENIVRLILKKKQTITVNFIDRSGKPISDREPLEIILDLGEYNFKTSQDAGIKSVRDALEKLKTAGFDELIGVKSNVVDKLVEEKITITKQTTEITYQLGHTKQALTIEFVDENSSKLKSDLTWSFAIGSTYNLRKDFGTKSTELESTIKTLEKDYVLKSIEEGHGNFGKGSGTSVDDTKFKAKDDGTDRLRYTFAPKASVTTTVQFVEVGKEETPLATTTFSGKIDSEITDLTNVTVIKSKIDELSKEYMLVGASDKLGKKLPGYPKYTIGSAKDNIIRLIFEKKTGAQITTTVKFINANHAALDNDLTIQINVGDIVNLNELAKDSIARVSAKGYAISKVEAFDFTSISFKEIPDPTAYKVPESTTGTGVVNYYFEEAKIITTIKFLDASGGSELMKSITSNNNAGDIINLNTIAKNSISAIKNLGYEIQKIEAFDWASISYKPVTDPTAYKVLANPNDTGAVNYYFKKTQIKTTVQFVEKGKEDKPLATTTFLEQSASKITDLAKVTEIKKELAKLSQYKVIGATDKNNKAITTYPGYTIGSAQDNLIRMVLNKKTQKLTVQFKTTDKEELDPVVKSIIIEETIGTEIELSKHEQIIKTLKAISDEHYQLVTQPNDKQIISESPQTVTYTFDGKLFIESAPSTMSFGKEKIQKGIHFIKVNNAEFDKPLVIWDSRKKSKNWKVTATLQKPFTNVGDSAQTLPDDVLSYKKDADNIVKFRQGDAEILAERTSEGTKNEYTVSEEWKSGKTGFKVEIPTNEIVAVGGYQAKILWQVGNTP